MRGLVQIRPVCDYLRAHYEDAYFSVRRTSFLATPADTVTVYAAQGSTYDAVVADMQRPPSFDLAKHWLACYVMLSRARTLEGFLVLRPATRTELSARPPKYLLDELDRLMRLGESSLSELVSYIEELPMDVPADILQILTKDAGAKQQQSVHAHRALADPSNAGQTLPPKRRLTGKQPQVANDHRGTKRPCEDEAADDARGSATFGANRR